MTDEAAIREIFGLSKKIGLVPFPTIVKVSSGFRVIPIDMTDEKDKALIATLKKVFNSYLDTLKRTHGRLEGDRANEVGSRIEAGLVHEMRSSGLKVEQLAKKGYPDIEILEQDNRLTYMEAKASSTLKPSRLRYFYYSGGKKIKGHARHLLLNIAISKVKDTSNIWKIEKFSLRDLSGLRVKLKTEFNTSQHELSIDSIEIFSTSVSWPRRWL